MKQQDEIIVTDLSETDKSFIPHKDYKVMIIRAITGLEKEEVENVKKSTEHVI